MSNVVRLCKDCGNFQGSSAKYECVAPQNIEENEHGDLVYGGILVLYKWWNAGNCRRFDDACGPDAKWFKEKT